MNESTTGNTSEVVRNEVLGLTSDFRIALEQLSVDYSDQPARETLMRSGRLLSSAVDRLGLQPMVRCGRALDRMAAMMTMLAEDEQPPAGQVYGSITDGLGIFEQCFEGCLDSVSVDHLDGLYDALYSDVPARWRGYIDLDETTFNRQVRRQPVEPSPTVGQPTATPKSPQRPLVTAVVTRITGRAPRSAAPVVTPPNEPVSSPSPPVVASGPESAFQRELLEAFTTEASEGFEQCEELLLHLEREPTNREVVDALFRQFHTLKGAAAAVDLSAAAQQLHEAESLLEEVRNGSIEIDSGALVDFLLHLADSVRGLIDLACGRHNSSYPIIADVAREIARLKAPLQTADGGPALDVGATGVMGVGLMDQQLLEITELRQQLGDSEVGDLRQYIEALDQQARQFWQIAATLKDRISTLRLTPLDATFRRLQRPLRDAARKEGRQVELELTGGDVRVERSVAERLNGPLLHLVRNAVSHGIEPPDIRAAAGKPTTGTVRVYAEQRATDVAISIEDDGAGLDLDAIRTKAEKLGWIQAADAPTPDELIGYMFRPGFSTKDEVSDLAGRGVGLDVVAHEIDEVKGHIEVETYPGQGTTFRLLIPSEKPNALQRARATTAADTQHPEVQ